jgi:hypothetical protein
MGMASLSHPLFSPVRTLAEGNYRNYFSFHSLVRRASCERLPEEALKRTLRVLPWYRARIAPSVLTRADFSEAKARSSGTIATILVTRPSTSFSNGP